MPARSPVQSRRIGQVEPVTINDATITGTQSVTPVLDGQGVVTAARTATGTYVLALRPSSYGSRRKVVALGAPAPHAASRVGWIDYAASSESQIVVRIADNAGAAANASFSIALFLSDVKSDI